MSLIELPAGVRVGHWHDERARTGCTAVLLPEGATASGEVRGGAPATRETDLLDPGRSVSTVDAVVLTGGSAFGLASAEGVMAWLAEHGRGYRTDAGPVPIVPALGLYDLGVGDPSVRPGPAEGAAACEAAAATVAGGRVGAGCGATVAKWRGAEHRRPGGLGVAERRAGEARIVAVVAVNALGDLTERAQAELDAGAVFASPPAEPSGRTNTTIGVVLTDAPLDPLGCHALARSAHDGFARALLPVHSGGDGDAVVVCATGTAPTVPVEVLRLHAVLVTEAAIRDALVS